MLRRRIEAETRIPKFPQSPCESPFRSTGPVLLSAIRAGKFVSQRVQGKGKQSGGEGREQAAANSPLVATKSKHQNIDGSPKKYKKSKRYLRIQVVSMTGQASFPSPHSALQVAEKE